MRWGRLRRCLLWSLVLCLLACSGTTFVYNRLDVILPWYVDRYVDLERDQSLALDAQLKVLLDWHRGEELSAYLQFLDDLDRDLAGPFTLAQLQAYADRAEQAWFRIRDPGLEQMLLLGETLSDEQLAGFMAVMDKKQIKYERKYLDRNDSEMREDAFESLQETLEDYLGRLDDTQLASLRDAAQALFRSDEVWLSERRAWTAELAQALKREPGWQQRVRLIVRDWEANLDPEVEAIYDHNTIVVERAVVEVLNSRSEKQKVRTQKKIAELREDLTLLIGEG
ncbi:MAG: DUF6279 family lipoprotein [Congregibacter sp.]|nr:DUF6279 family lipoprotein [Congregibacter sp.]